MASILGEIAACKRERVRRCKARCSEGRLLARAAKYEPRDFAGVLTAHAAGRETAIIAEVKKASPSRGVIRPDFDPVAIATAYEAGGAACLSVLTDEKYFQGSDAYLTAIRESTGIPVLRKDFILDPYQVLEARAIGADAILIILAMLDDALARELCAAAREQGLSILPEVHDTAELERALVLDTRLVGINNRNLHSFETRLETTLELLPALPDGKTVISESGIFTRRDILHMNQAGIYGFLVGEALMRSSDPAAALSALLGRAPG